MVIYHKLPHYHIDRSRIHPFTIGMILSSLVCSLLTLWTVASPTYPQGFSLPPWAVGRMRQIRPLLHGSSLTHTQLRNIFPPWATGKNASSNVKGHWSGSNSSVTKIMKTKSRDHREITHGIVLKPHKTHRLHYFQISSLYLGSFRKISNNPTSTKFVRFST